MEMGFKWPVQRTETEKQNIIARSRDRGKFNPDRAYIQKAVEQYLKNGGTIKRVEVGPDVTDLGFYDYEFLSGQI
jgi:hypothetical protein